MYQLTDFQNGILGQIVGINQGTFVNALGEIIIERKDNVWFRLTTCNNYRDIQKKCLHFLSRPMMQYSQYRPRTKTICSNVFYHFVPIKFTNAEIELIYSRLGNCCNEELTEKFIDSGFDIKILKKEDK
jgi:hypothetical protein